MPRVTSINIVQLDQVLSGVAHGTELFSTVRDSTAMYYRQFWTFILSSTGVRDNIANNSGADVGRKNSGLDNLLVFQCDDYFAQFLLV